MLRNKPKIATLAGCFITLPPRRKAWLCLGAIALALWAWGVSVANAQAPVDGAWEANARVVEAQVCSDEHLGAAQGVSYHDGRLYFYGDVYTAKPRVGVVREYTLDLQYTGRHIELSRQGKPLICHPTGLAWNPQFGCFLGDTVHKVGHIYQLDWERALADENLDRAVVTEILDDAATNGCRPEYVTYRGRTYLATADYGDVRPAVRLYDPRALVAARRSSAPGVLAYRIPCGPFNQNLFWDAAAGELTCVQNVVAGLGWKLDVFRLDDAIAAGSLEHARVRTLVFRPHTELEGYLKLGDGREVFVTSSRRENLILGRGRVVERFTSPPGSR